ncbi:BON domain-containing protein [Ensifer sp. M14]|uniref:BON domain-containing protein n=1 Tax=Ensifer sp. M14 TaxID=2203782 RepID=UPI000E1DAD78|nr:BON domain-containing protein [Ensifer sp. M14]
MDLFGTGFGLKSVSADTSLIAAISAAIAMDDVCAGQMIEVSSTPGCIILEGSVPSLAAIRAKEIARNVAGGALVLDRMLWRD